MKDNPLRRLGDLGQSVWLDYLDRNMINSGELEQLINEDGVRGVTSNPAIFAKAFSGSTAYDEEISILARRGRTVPEIYEQLTLADVRNAADLFRSGFNASDKRHGFVSLEVDPHLARDTEGTIEEARRLWRELDRPNVFIKVPATIEGLPAIQQLVSEGINVNVTLLFGLDRYRQVAEAYIAGLERMMEEGRSPSTASVASFFLSRIDVLVDEHLGAIAAEGGERGAQAAALRGEIAVASAKQAYRMYREIYAAERFRKLAVQRARPQRLLWASTSTKNPAYSDVKYVEPLIGPETINTMPRKTMDAYRDHGQPAVRLEEGVDEAVRKHQQLTELGIDLDQVTAQLEEEGIEKFNRPYDGSMEDLGRKTKELTEVSGAH